METDTEDPMQAVVLDHTTIAQDWKIHHLLKKGEKKFFSHIRNPSG